MDDQNPNPTTRMDTPTPEGDPNTSTFGGPATPPSDAEPPPSGTFGALATPPSYVPPVVPPEAPSSVPPAQPSTAAPLVAAPVSSWAQPKPRRDGGRIWSVVAGLFLLGFGLWFFADRTLGLAMPEIRWSQFWPVILIVIGVAILLGALRRERR